MVSEMVSDLINQDARVHDCRLFLRLLQLNISGSHRKSPVWEGEGLRDAFLTCQ